MKNLKDFHVKALFSFIVFEAVLLIVGWVVK